MISLCLQCKVVRLSSSVLQTTQQSLLLATHCQQRKCGEEEPFEGKRLPIFPWRTCRTDACPFLAAGDAASPVLGALELVSRSFFEKENCPGSPTASCRGQWLPCKVRLDVLIWGNIYRSGLITVACNNTYCVNKLILRQ